jgi:hypothetical protein
MDISWKETSWLSICVPSESKGSGVGEGRVEVSVATFKIMPYQLQHMDACRLLNFSTNRLGFLSPLKL